MTVNFAFVIFVEVYEQNLSDLFYSESILASWEIWGEAWIWPGKMAEGKIWNYPLFFVFCFFAYRDCWGGLLGEESTKVQGGQ